jgi:NADPH2:quinone reductase
VDLVLDAVGGPMFEPALKSLRLGGRQVAITSVGRRRVNNGGAKTRGEFAAGP